MGDTKIIAVVGATGAQGGGLVRAILDDPGGGFVARVLTRDVEMHGRKMSAGDRVLLLLGAANRDEREFDHPDRFDVRRKIERTVAFGHGVHVSGALIVQKIQFHVDSVVSHYPFTALLP